MTDDDYDGHDWVFSVFRGRIGPDRIDIWDGWHGVCIRGVDDGLSCLFFSFLFFSFFSLFFSLWLPLFFHFPSRPEREYET